MSLASLAITLGAIIAVICIVDAYRWNRTPQTLYRFFLLEGRLRLKGFVSTILAANLSLGNFMIFIATWGYLFGTPGLIWFVLNLILNVVGFRLFFPHFRNYIESHDNNGTIHDFLATSYGTGESDWAAARIRLSASLVTVIGLLFAIVFELSLAISLFSPETQSQRISMFVSLTILICVFTAYGGFRTLIVSDVCQASLLALATIVLLIVMIVTGGSHIPALFSSFQMRDFSGVGWPNMLSISIIGSGWLLVAMDQWQRTCASRSYDTTKKGVTIYLILISFFALVYALWGMYDKSLLLPALDATQQAQHSGGANPLSDILLIPALHVPTAVVYLIACGLIAAGLSTTNTFLTVSSHSLTTDVLLVSMSHRTLQDLDDKENRTFVGIGRAIIIGTGAVIVLTFAGLTMWGFLTDPLSFFFIAYSIQFALLAPMVMSRVKLPYRPTALAALVSIGIGLVVALSLGFGAWVAIQRSAPPALGIAPGDWLTLTPVFTFFVGLIPLVVSILIRKFGNNERSTAPQL